MQNIVAQIITRCETTASFQHISEVAPFFEIDPHWDHSKRELAASVMANHARFGRRCFNTHLPWEFMPRGDGDGHGDGHGDGDGDGEQQKQPKCIYLVRDGRDAATSFYHHLSNQAPAQGGYTGGWEAFFDEWIRGEIAFGSWPTHLRSWQGAVSSSASSSVLVVRYAVGRQRVVSRTRRQNQHQIIKRACEEFDQKNSSR